MTAPSPDTRLSQVLDAIPGALDYVVGLNPHDFARLRNPVLRRYMTSRISLRRVAAMAHVPPEELVDDLAALAAGNSLPTDRRRTPPEASPASPATERAPAWLRNVDLAAIPWVDVVPIDDVAGDPFPPISPAVKQLPPGGVLAIRHRGEPQPLYDVWSKMRLEWYVRQVGEREWYVFVHRPATVPALPTKPLIGAEVGQIPAAEVLPRLCALAEQLAPGQTLEATGLPSERLDTVRTELQAELGDRFEVVEAADWRGRPSLRLVSRAPSEG